VRTTPEDALNRIDRYDVTTRIRMEAVSIRGGEKRYIPIDRLRELLGEMPAHRRPAPSVAAPVPNLELGARAGLPRLPADAFTRPFDTRWTWSLPRAADYSGIRAPQVVPGDFNPKLSFFGEMRGHARYAATFEGIDCVLNGRAPSALNLALGT